MNPIVKTIEDGNKLTNLCNSMPYGAAWAYYGKVLVLANVAS